MRIFRLDSSIRTEGSVTRAIMDTFESALTAEVGSAEIARRDVGLHPLDASLWGAAAFGGATGPEERSAEVALAIDAATGLADEVTSADALLFAVPMYNFGVSQHFKTWFDLVLTDPRLGPGSTTIAGRPAVLVTARGGGYGPGTPREGWDHATAWMRRMLSELWGLDLEVIETELTLAEVTPAMESLRDMAREQLAASHGRAAGAAQSMARRVRPVPVEV